MIILIIELAGAVVLGFYRLFLCLEGRKHNRNTVIQKSGSS
ncbi:hypothetical protein ACFOU2_07410 [Bacillus songklensis]|uniref:Uncharacterized protein n=1 Tax=Bacillus songklensis TaxID=1069116 RepID=A0ABV8B0Z4_9BACI